MVANPYSNYINGTWQSGPTVIDNINPANTEDLIGHYAAADAHQITEAIQAANAAQPAWAATGPETRYAALMRIGETLKSRSAELGHELSREEGKPLAEGKAEVFRAGQFFTYYAAEAHRLSGERIDSVRPNIEVDTRREPVGTVGIISPWNFPLATAVWKIAPALVYGNAVVWKPSEEVPHSAWALADIISNEDALSNGEFNLVNGTGPTAGQALVESTRLDAISFTGSLEVGSHVLATAAKNRVAVQLEMGSKNPLVIMEDADIETAVSAAIAGGYSGSGQKCTASSRLIVHDAIHEQFVDELVKRLRSMTVGDPIADEAQIGPIINQNQLERIESYLTIGEQAGATRRCGGQRVSRNTPGHFLSPALLTDTRNDMQVNREEIFGPVACVIRVNDFEEAVAIANDTDYGLTSGIVTASLRYATEFRRRSASGCVMVNLPTAGTDYHVPFGGRGASSFGPSEQGQSARDFYTKIKTSYVRIG